MNLDDLDSPTDIAKKLMEVKPRVIISSIEDISNADMQAELQSVDIRYVAIDECQVIICYTEHFKLVNLSPQLLIVLALIKPHPVISHLCRSWILLAVGQKFDLTVSKHGDS